MQEVVVHLPGFKYVVAGNKDIALFNDILIGEIVVIVRRLTLGIFHLHSNLTHKTIPKHLFNDLRCLFDMCCVMNNSTSTVCTISMTLIYLNRSVKNFLNGISVYIQHNFKMIPITIRPFLDH